MKKLFSVYDSKSMVYDQPWLAPNKGAAMRAVLDVLKDPNHHFTKWPADFTLFEIGEWDELTGTLVPHVAKINCGVMIELIQINQPSDQGSKVPRDVTPTQVSSLKSKNKEDESVTRQ